METQQGFLTSDLGVEKNAHELADTRPKMHGATLLFCVLVVFKRIHSGGVALENAKGLVPGGVLQRLHRTNIARETDQVIITDV